MGSKPVAVLRVAIAVPGVGGAPSSFGWTDLRCAATPEEAAVQDRQVVAASQEAFMTVRDRAALVCLADAVVALDCKFDAPSSDAKALEGPRHPTQGIVITQPSASEDE
jgi:hypothetical protein